MYKIYGIGWTILLIAAIGGCGGDDDPASGEDPGAITGGTGATETTEPGTGGTGGSGSTSSTPGGTSVKCGNGTKEGTEECDDGNKDDSDGCKSTCEFYCHKDADCSTDVCAGKSSVCDTKTGMCSKSGDGYADGTKCSDNASCQKGACVAHQCGNTYAEGTEECDDGNKEDFDGCNTKCKFTCVKGDATRSCVNDCDLASTCDDAHKCVAGAPVADGALCNRGDGFCKAGQCVITVCGDGEKSVNEECDKGEANNDASDCTKKCTLAICGDGKMGEKEQCDDGNTTNLDGCDSKCKVELMYRAAQFRLSEDPAPEFCYYAKSKGHLLDPASNGNAMGKMVASIREMVADLTAAGEDPTAVLTDQAVVGSGMAFVFHVLDVDDPSFKTEDPLINIGETVGVPDTKDENGKDLPDGSLFSQVSNSQRLDWPIRFYRQHFNDAGIPIQILKGKIGKESANTTTETTAPSNTGFDIAPVVRDGGTTFEGGTFGMHNISIKLINDTTRSKIKRPETNSWVEIPDSTGGFDVSASTTDYTKAQTANGIMCGAVDTDLMAKMPLPAPGRVLGVIPMGTEQLCPNQEGKVRGCENGVTDLEAGNCDSVLDLMIEGCTGGLIDLMQPMGNPDVDTNGDGKGDAYSMVSNVAAQRVTMSPNGFMEGEPPATPILVK